MDEVSLFSAGSPHVSDPAPAAEPHQATWDRPRVLRLREASPQEDAPAAAAAIATPGETGSRGDLVPAPVLVDAERGAPVPIRGHYAAVIAGCLERMAMLSRHRDERPWRERAGIEARLLAQVDAIVEARVSVPDLVAFWDDEAEDDPRATWAVIFALGSLEGGAPLAGVLHLVNKFPVDAEEHALLAAEALVAAPHPERVALGRDLRRSAHPLARAVATELLSRLGQLGAEAVVEALDDANGAVKAAGLRALARGPSLDAALSRVRACLRHEEAMVVWEAARALTVGGHGDAYEKVCDGDGLAVTLGWRALEILVMAGGPEDLSLVERLVKRQPMTPEVLSAVARFGHPAAWPYLVHGLGRPEVAEDAERALVTLFGPLVAEEQEEATVAWRKALADGEIPPGTRWRRGEPWSPAAVLAECAIGELSRREVELRHDEIRARTGKSTSKDLAAWDAPARLS
jgi:hypothetical protein